jgi:hypothetical protein
MDALKCPNCGSPAQPGSGQERYQCPYCGTVFDTGFRPTPQPSQQIPAIIVFEPEHSYAPVPVRAVTSGIGTMIRLFVILIIVAATGGFAAIARCSSLASSLVWDGSTPFTCAGNDTVSLKEVHAQFTAGTAVSVSGNCHFTCTDCSIQAPVAIEVAGNGNVTIVNGSVIGSAMMVDASGNAHVNISGNVTASGFVRQNGNARVNAPTPAPTPSPTPTPMPTVPAVKPVVAPHSVPPPTPPKKPGH